MIISIIVILFMLCCSPAFADDLHVMVEYRCNNPKDTVQVLYKSGRNETGSEMLNNRPENAFDLWEWVTVEKNGDFSKIIPISKKCDLSDGSYEVTIEPMPGNENINRRFGHLITARVIISKHNKIITAVS